MTEIEKLILKSLRSTTVMQCHAVKCNPKTGVMFLGKIGG